MNSVLRQVILIVADEFGEKPIGIDDPAATTQRHGNPYRTFIQNSQKSADIVAEEGLAYFNHRKVQPFLSFEPKEYSTKDDKTKKNIASPSPDDICRSPEINQS